jgi:hypothetical protein
LTARSGSRKKNRRKPARSSSGSASSQPTAMRGAPRGGARAAHPDRGGVEPAATDPTRRRSAVTFGSGSAGTR